MRIDEIVDLTNQSENIDGDEVYIFDNTMQESLKKLVQRADSEKDNILISMLRKDIDFICNHSQFAIAFRPVKCKEITKWMPCLIYKFEEKWRRVVIQYAKCVRCEWAGSIANPTEPDLYITSKKCFEILHEMNKLSFCKCHLCDIQ